MSRVNVGPGWVDEGPRSPDPTSDPLGGSPTGERHSHVEPQDDIFDFPLNLIGSASGVAGLHEVSHVPDGHRYH